MTTTEVKEARAWMVTDWAVREFAPAWLRLAGLVERAHELESLPPVVSPESASAGQTVIDRADTDAVGACDAARGAAWATARVAAWHAARDAAWAAADDAAWDTVRYFADDAAWATARVAAWDTAWYAARDAAVVAAWYAARDAARVAAWDAARAALAPTVTALRESAVALADRMHYGEIG